MKNSIEVLAIGDIVTDAFIELLPSEAEIESDHKKHPLLCMTYGTKIPFKNATVVAGVGNAPNAAVACARLGVKTALMSNLGGDETGEDMLLSLTKNKVSAEFVTSHASKSSNYHYVLWYGADRTILIKHEEYTYTWPRIAKYQTPEWIYLSSLGEAGSNIHGLLLSYLHKHPEVKLAFQPGTFQIRLGHKPLKGLYAATQIIAANKEEFGQILGTDEQDEKVLIAKMHELGPKTVLLTDGPAGAYASDGKQVLFHPPYPDPKAPLERTGAGDSYASTFTAAVMQGESIERAMAWAGVNSCSVVQQVGAQAGLLSMDELESQLAKAPKNYVAKQL